MNLANVFQRYRANSEAPYWVKPRASPMLFVAFASPPPFWLLVPGRPTAAEGPGTPPSGHGIQHAVSGWRRGRLSRIPSVAAPRDDHLRTVHHGTRVPPCPSETGGLHPAGTHLAFTGPSALPSHRNQVNRTAGQLRRVPARVGCALDRQGTDISAGLDFPAGTGWR